MRAKLQVEPLEQVNSRTTHPPLGHRSAHFECLVCSSTIFGAFGEVEIIASESTGSCVNFSRHDRGHQRPGTRVTWGYSAVRRGGECRGTLVLLMIIWDGMENGRQINPTTPFPFCHQMELFLHTMDENKCQLRTTPCGGLPGSSTMRGPAEIGTIFPTGSL